jgi:hypothetical protein
MNQATREPVLTHLEGTQRLKGDAAGLTREERDVVRRLSGGVGWPAILLALALAVAQVGPSGRYPSSGRSWSR